MHAWHWWATAAVALVVAEIFVPGFFLACFAIGCLLASALAFMRIGPEIQIVAFCVGTFAAFLAVRPLMLKLGRATPKRMNAGALVGKLGVVSEAIVPPMNQGRALVEGEDWWAVSADETPIDQGQRVRVLQVDGAKVVVEPS